MKINVKEAIIAAAFEEHKKNMAHCFIGAGEGNRVNQMLSKLSYDEFKAGWLMSESYHESIKHEKYS